MRTLQNKNILRTFGRACGCLALAIKVAVAAEVRVTTYQLDIPSQPLADALQSLAMTSQHKLFYDAALVKGKNSPALKGEFTAEQAVKQLLSGTNLSYEVTEDGLVLIRPSTAPATTGARTSNSNGVRLAQADTVERTTPSAVEEIEVFVQGIPEILVTGARTLNMDIERTRDDVQPYVVFDRKQIEQSSASNLEDFLRQRLPMNAQTSSLAQQPSQVGSSSSINLRGLGTNQTLILVDGHRRASFGASGVPQQPDLNGIPLSAIERIEVLPTTASGIYGGSATGGVINIVLRRDYSGVETKLTYENAFEGGGESRRVDLSAGYTTDSGRTNVLFAGSYVDAGRLSVSDRDLLQDGRDEILARNPAFFYGSANPPLGATTNIRSANGANLVLKSGGALNSPITFVPEGYAGAGADLGAALQANAGQYNLDLANTAQPSGGGRGGLLNSPTVESFTTTVRHEFTDRLRAFVELGASNNSGYFRTNNAASTFLIPRTSASNPFDQDIRVTTPAFGGDDLIVTSNHVRRAVGGVIMQLPGDWHSELDYTFERTRFTSSTPGGLSAAASTAVANGTLDVLRDTNAFPVDFSPYVNPPTYQSPIHTTLKDAALRFAGPLFSLPGGALNVATLLEHRDEILGSQTSLTGGPVQTPSLSPGKSQSVDSVYVEVRAPLFSANNAIPGIHELELQLAGRHDRYETEGASATTQGAVSRATNKVHSTDPTLGLRYSPVTDVMFRTSYGTGFVPPGVTDLVPTAPSSLPGSLLGLRDPRRGGEAVGGTVTLLSGGNPDLTPEESESQSVGVVFTPRFVNGLRVSIDWTRIEKDDEITNIPISQSALDNEAALPSTVITRETPAAGDPFGVGRIIGWNTRRLNIARKTVEAYDLALDYVRETQSLGAFQFFAGATRQTRFEVQTISSAPAEERAGLVTALKWRGTAGINWRYRTWTVGWNSRYLDSYWANVAHTVNVVQGGAQVGSQIYHDAFVNWAAPATLGESLLARTQVQVGIKNLFDKQPPFDATNLVAVGGNLYSPLGDPRLRSFFVSVEKVF